MLQYLKKRMISSADFDSRDESYRYSYPKLCIH